MGLEIQTIESADEIFAGPKVDIQKHVTSLENLEEIRQEIKLASSNAVEHSLKYADSLVKGLSQELVSIRVESINALKREIQQIAKPTQQILVVKVDEVKRKLTKAASPYLGECLIQAGCRLNTYLVGPAGCGKTTLAEQVAEAMGLRFGHVSLTQGASETWLAGRWSPGGEFITAQFIDFFEHGGVFLIDEVDGADANLAVFLNTALANGSFANPMTGKIHKKHKDFVCIAAGNTYGKGGNAQYTGRTRQDAAFLDRFAGCALEMDYSKDIEKQLCPDVTLRRRLLRARKFLKDKKATEMITTRALMNAFTLKSQGLTEKRIYEKLTLSWPQELRDQSGLLLDEPVSASSSDDDEILPF